MAISFRARIINSYLRYVWRNTRNWQGKTLDAAIVEFQRSMRLSTWFLPPAPASATKNTVKLQGFDGTWVWSGKSQPERVILYCHGGAFVAGSPNTYSYMAWRLSRYSNASVLLIDYTLAPEAKCPSAIREVIAAYRYLLDQGYPADRIAFCGDSAGGNLALAALLEMADEKLPAPAAAVAISPMVDANGVNGDWGINAENDIILDPHHLSQTLGAYIGDLDRNDRRVSPLNGDLAVLPPTLVQVGSPEILLSDARRFARKMSEAGAVCELRIWQDMQHVWHLGSILVPEARRALAEIGEFVNKHYPPNGDQAPGRNL